MITIKDFPTADVLGVVTGRLLADIGGIYNVLSYMASEDVYTHQIPRISTEATPVLLKLRPDLKEAIDEAHNVTPENVQEWVERWVARYGETLPVPVMTIAEHERIDPLSELAEQVPPDKIVVVKG